MSSCARATAILTAIALLVSLLAAHGCVKPGSAGYVLVCTSSAVIESGMPITARGVKIGQITSVDLEDDGMVGAHMAIDRKYRNLVRTDSEFAVNVPLLKAFLNPDTKDDDPRTSLGIGMTVGNGEPAPGGTKFTLDSFTVE